MQKSADAFRTISEVADDLSLPQHVLRFWETRFPQIRPLKRAGGRRYYRPNDVVLLRTIRQLLYDDGYTIKGVQRLLKEQGVKGLGTSPPPDLPNVDEFAPEMPSELHSFDGEQSGIYVASEEPHVCRAGAGPLGRAALEDALAVLDECRRILETARRADAV